MVHASNPPQPQCMSLMTLHLTNVLVQVTSLYPSISFSENVTINSTNGEYLCLDNDIQLNGTGLSRKVVRVMAQENISVIVHDLELHSVDSYTAIPIQNVGTKYYIVTLERRSQFSVTATENDTQVAIQFPVRLGETEYYKVVYKGITFINPTLEMTLQKYDVFNLYMDKDLTGTFVSSNKAIVVVSGNKKTSTKGSSDHLAEQMPSVDTWGMYFITVPSPKKTNDDYYRIVTSEPNTQVTIQNNTHTLDNEGDWLQVSISASVPMEIIADKAVLVVKIVTTIKNKIDNCMMLIVPNRQWTHQYNFMFPRLSDYGYLMVLVETRYKTSLTLNSGLLGINNWMVIGQTNISFGYMRLPNGYNTLQSPQVEIVFTAYIHQDTRPAAFCSSLGMKTEKLNMNWIHNVKNQSCAPLSTPEPTATVPSSTITSADELTSATTEDTTSPTSPTSPTTTPHTTMTSTSTPVTETLTTTTTTTTVGYSKTTCVYQGVRNYNVTDKELTNITEQLQRHLKIVPNQTSQNIRKKISVPDPRHSSTAFGLSAWVVISSLLVGFTLLSDFRRLLQDLRRGVR